MRRAGLILAAAVLLATAVGQAPAPPARQVVPRARLVGLFEPVASSWKVPEGQAVRGRVLLDAGDSVSELPIRWRQSGPGAILIPRDTADGRPDGVAIAYIAAPGRYRFQAIARGHDADGHPDADAAAWDCQLEEPPGPAPQPAPQPTPQPQPAPQPQPYLPQPNPSRPAFPER